MIYVTSGHEKSVGLEVFIKSFLSLKRNDHKKFTLIINSDLLCEYLNTLKINYTHTSTALIIYNIFLLNYINIPITQNSTIDSLNKALEIISFNDILFTLPSSKDQFLFKDKVVGGHTEYFRKYFSDIEISMFFNRNDLNILLLSDHISLKEVPYYLNSELIFNKTKLTLSNLDLYFNNKIEEVIFTGINPHAGENGLLGNEEIFIKDAMRELEDEFPLIKFTGPIPSDTAILSHSSSKQLFIYPSHDSGLGVFKGINRLNGANITFGLPFLRLSVDHGTAFDLYGKNLANYSGCLEILRSLV
jgi:4-hydroxythreonine-4-phosphate dehydrogenase